MARQNPQPRGAALHDRRIAAPPAPRQGAPSYPECALAGDAELREEILDERAREFAFEEIRWFDIVRWKRADIFQQTLYGIRVTILDGTDSSNFRFNFSEPIPETDRAWKNSFDPKWYLSAFPSNEVNKGYGLTQNAGW